MMRTLEHYKGLTIADLKALCQAVKQDNKEFLADKDNEKILLCAGGGCLASGAMKVKKALQEAIDAHQLEHRVTLLETGCLGPCSHGPVLVMERDKTFYQGVKPDDAEEIICSHVLNGKVVKRLTWLDGEGMDDRPIPIMTDIDFFRLQTKIVLRNCGNIDPENITDYIGADGYQALAKVLESMSPEMVIEEMKISGLRGRGGGGFPTWMKWKLASQNPGTVKYILCNADEGDPGAFMDRSVLEGDPHSIIEGMAIGAYAIGATQGYIYVRAEYPLAVERLEKAIVQARKCGLLGKDVLGVGFEFDLEIRMGSGAFVCGEETALIASIEGCRGEPRPRPPFPAQKGLWGKPTVLNNVETFANIAAIILKGGDWFAAHGLGNSKGTKVFALAGAVNHSGLAEVPVGTTLGELIYDIGGGIKGGKAFKAAQLGGPSGGCIPKAHLNVPLDYEALQELGAIMGSGGLIAMDEDTCMVDVARFFMEFVQEESCGKCVPCRVGTKRMLEILERICEGNGKADDIDKLIEMGEQIKETSLCGLGQTAPNPVLSTIRHFRHEYEDHIFNRHCEAGVCPGLVRAPCQSACPAHVDVPGFISLVGEKRYAEALRLHRERNPFASVCARVCFHLCEDKCRRSTLDEPVCVRGIKRYMTDQEITIQLPEIREDTKNAVRKVAIIGAGPAGLSCGYFLARLGYRPTIFEAEMRPGGMLAQAIPAYRLPRETLAREIRMIENMGVTIRTEQRLGRDFTISALQENGYEAIFIGVGAPLDSRIDIPGIDAQGVRGAIPFLREYNIRGSVPVGKKVVVIGGGNCAVDAARTALRLDAAVTIIYRRTQDEMPAYAEEIEEALQEGVEIITLANPQEIIVHEGKVSGIRCARMKLGQFDSTGRRHPEEGDDIFLLDADQILVAIGQTLNCGEILDTEQIKTRKGSQIMVDPITAMTSMPGIFAGGDAVSGPDSVISAVAAGERAAVGIDEFFTGERHAFWREEKDNDTAFDPDSDPLPYPRAKMNLIPVERRRNNFDEVEKPWTEGEAVRQAKRCLRCDYGKSCTNHGGEVIK
jgi:NADH-quinone oxidoreductase subunit F